MAVSGVSQAEEKLEQLTSIETISQVIQEALAPVFLIAGIAGLLGALSSRLGRIIDRARVIELRMARNHNLEQQLQLRTEVSTLWSRVRLITWAIRLCVIGALLICMVIVVLFVGELTTANLSLLIAFLFVSAMLFIISGLLFFLREIGLSAGQSQQGMEAILNGIDEE